jgi:hypothetical protein
MDLKIYLIMKIRVSAKNKVIEQRSNQQSVDLRYNTFPIEPSMRTSNMFKIFFLDVETTPYIEPTEEISTTTKTKISILNSENGCPDYFSAVVGEFGLDSAPRKTSR